MLPGLFKPEIAGNTAVPAAPAAICCMKDLRFIHVHAQINSIGWGLTGCHVAISVDICHTRHGYRWNREGGECKIIWHQALWRVHDLFPCDFLTRITGFAPHDSRHGAMGYLFCLIQWFIVSNALYQIRVFLNVCVVALFRIFKDQFALCDVIIEWSGFTSATPSVPMILLAVLFRQFSICRHMAVT